MFGHSKDQEGKIHELVQKGKWDKLKKYLSGSKEEQISLAKACKLSSCDDSVNLLINLLNFSLSIWASSVYSVVSSAVTLIADSSSSSAAIAGVTPTKLPNITAMAVRKEKSRILIFCFMMLSSLLFYVFENPLL